MKKLLLSLLLIVYSNLNLFSQQTDNNSNDQVLKNIDESTFNVEDWRERLNHDFAKLMGAAGENMNIGSFASLDLVNPKFNFNGAIPVSSKNLTKPISILAITAQGLIDADNIGHIFSNRKKSSSGSVGVAYHFGVRFSPPVIGEEELSLIKIKDQSIKGKRDLAYDQLILRRSQLKNQITKFVTQIVNYNAINTKLNIRIDILDSLITEFTVQIQQDDFKSSKVDSVKKYTKELSDTYDLILSNLGSIRNNQFKVDSLNVELLYTDADGERENLINREAGSAILKARNEAFLYKYSLNWWSVEVTYGRDNIFVYDPLLSYHQRISPKTYNLFSSSLSYNFYRQDKLSNLTFLVRASLGYSKTVNTDFYNTTPITEEFVDKDSLGTTTRKTVTNYYVYTDKILSANRMRLFVDSFLFLNSSQLGIHVFPEVVSLRSDKYLINCGAGIVAAFRNRKKDVPLINLELFAKFYEIGVSEESKELLHNLTLGVKLSTPFNFF